jgi:hypothetical protein
MNVHISQTFFELIDGRTFDVKKRGEIAVK